MIVIDSTISYCCVEETRGVQVDGRRDHLVNGTVRLTVDHRQHAIICVVPPGVVVDVRRSLEPIIVITGAGVRLYNISINCTSCERPRPVSRCRF